MQRRLQETSREREKVVRVTFDSGDMAVTLIYISFSIQHDTV